MAKHPLTPGKLYAFQLKFTAAGSQPALMGADWKAGQIDTAELVCAKAVEMTAQKLGLRPNQIRVISFRIAPK